MNVIISARAHTHTHARSWELVAITSRKGTSKVAPIRAKKV